MNQSEKTRIKELREDGMGYAEIARKMDISINTIKSFCRRNGLGGIKKDESNLTFCKFCFKPVNQYLGKKRKKFCSDSCRNKWWNTHMEDVDKRANYRCICLACGQVFISYGNKNRKYCSHQCYINDRFGGRDNASN